jgi:hypothetical protein
VAGALVGGSLADEAGLRARIASVFEGEDVSQADELMGVSTEDLLEAVRAAGRAAS